MSETNEDILSSKGKFQQMLENALSSALNLPGVKVDRNNFLRSALQSIHINNEDIDKAINDSPLKVLSESQIKKLVKSTKTLHRTHASVVSGGLGIPGGFAMVGTIPADILQYFRQVFIFAQKISFLYGFPQLRSDDEFKNMMIIALGVAAGVDQANQGLTFMSKAIQRKVLQKISEQQGKWINQIVFNVFRAVGITLNKQLVKSAAKKVIPLASAAISAGITYLVFGAEADKIIKGFEENRISDDNKNLEGDLDEDIVQ